jgi:LPXTG-site transpeptidase (sortase) family protein
MSRIYLFKKISIGILIIIAMAIFITTLIRAVYSSSLDEIPLPKESKISEINKSTSLYPMNITIPKIRVDAKVEEVGITKKGNMATPNSFAKTGWYKYGTIPGETGSAVIAGHVDNGLALPGVFSNLKNLKKGDDIYIATKNENLHFIVTESDIYDFDAPTNEIFEDKDEKLLKLITCTGNWITEYKTHDKRLVVTAKLTK